MNELPSTKDLSTGNRDLKSERSVGAPKRRSLTRLCFTAFFGLISMVAAINTTVLTLSAGWRYFWLTICLFALTLTLTGIILFEKSYKKQLAGDALHVAAIRMFFSWLIGKEVLEKNSAREAENPLLFT